ncbi:hypothetical protein WJX79_009746 [Trebouxia sp. C0005]
MSGPGSPTTSYSSGTSDLMALLDQGLQSDHSDAEENPRDPQRTQVAISQVAGVERLAKRQRIDASQPICPPHPGLMHGMCIRCGASIHEQEETAIPLKYLHMGLQISAQEAERIRTQHLKVLLSKKKLLLVLDLDHTLLNSTRMADLPEETHKLFELHIYTHGDQDYAAEMAKLLDPNKTFFGGRVISARDSTQRHVKSLDVVLGADTSVLILDDTEGVWPAHAANLIQVDRYIFFPACVSRFGRSHKSLLEAGKDEDVGSGMLSTSLRVVQQVHQRLFQASDPGAEDVRAHLQNLRKQVLAGVHIVFSHVIPLEQDVTQHHLWRLASQLGATCHAKVTDDVTHVVASAMDTDKMHWAKRHNRHRVSVNWLYVSGFHWEKASEAKHPVTQKQADALLQEPVDDTAAAIAAAGGGQGLVLEAQ